MRDTGRLRLHRVIRSFCAGLAVTGSSLVAVLLATQSPAGANAANPATTPSPTLTETQNTNGSVTVSISGNWTWVGQECSARFAVGWGMIWNDSSDAGYTVSQGSVSAQVGSADTGSAYATPTGTTTIGSNVITGVSSVTNLMAGMGLVGTGIPTGAEIESVGSGTITMSLPATASHTGTVDVFLNPLDENVHYYGQGVWATTSSTSDVVTLAPGSSTTGIAVGQWVVGTNIQSGKVYVTAVGSNTVTLSADPTSTLTSPEQLVFVANSGDYPVNLPNQINGNTTASSATISVGGAASQVAVGMEISGSDIPSGDTVTAVGSNTITIGPLPATSTTNNVALTLTNPGMASYTDGPNFIGGSTFPAPAPTVQDTYPPFSSQCSYQTGSGGSAESFGTWGPETHTYTSLAAVPPQICVNMYDLHMAPTYNSSNTQTNNDYIVDKAGDNSIKSNAYDPSAGGCADTNSLTTTVSGPSSGPVGTYWNDSALVTGNSEGGTPSGSVTFMFCTVTVGSSCTGGSTVDTMTGASSTTSTTATYTLPVNYEEAPSTPGTYCYNAAFSATSGTGYSSVPAQLDTECFTVAQASSNTTTHPATASIVLGNADTDSATVTGNSVAGAPSGTVSFYECGPTASATACTSQANPVGAPVNLTPGAGATSSATSPSFTPTATGWWCFAGYYSGSISYSASSDATTDECVDVTAINITSPTTPTSLIVVLGNTNSDSLTVTGNAAGGTPTGTVNFYECGPTASATPCTSQANPVGGSVNLTPGAGDTANASSATFTPTSTGTWCFAGYYSGNSNYQASADTSTDECFTVSAAPTSTATTPTTSSIVVGSTDGDSATVTGNATGGSPTGTVSFYECGPTASATPCTSKLNPVGSPVSLTTGANDMSSAGVSGFLPTAPGWWCFAGYYSGSSQYLASADSTTDECFDVAAASSSTATTPNSASIVLGNTDNDSATVTGNSADGSPTGTVSFYECGPSASAMPCTSQSSPLGSAVTLTTGANDMSTASSPTFDPDAPGWWCFAGYYSGNTDYLSSSDTTTDECFDVTAAPTSTTTTPASSSIVLAGSDSDAATVTGNAADGSPMGTVQFYECGPTASATPCTSQANPLGGAMTLTAGAHHTATASSPSFTPTSTGWWCFAGDYSGSNDYQASSDTTADECFDVTAASTSTATQPSTSVVPLGDSTTDSATVTGNATGGSPTGTVTFYECGPTSSPAACTSQANPVGAAVAVTAGPNDTATATSVPFTASGVGWWCYAGDYSGDSNYSSSADTSTDECFDVTGAPSQTTTTPTHSSIVLGASNTDQMTVTGTAPMEMIKKNKCSFTGSGANRVKTCAEVVREVRVSEAKVRNTSGGNPVGGSPTGTVTFYQCGPTASATPCTSQANQIGNPVPLTAGPDNTASAMSPGFTPTSTGWWCFAGYYSGSTNYESSSDATTDECFDVTSAPTNTTTQPVSSSIVFGNGNADSVTVAGNAAGGSPTGSVSFYQCGPTASPAACTSQANPVGGAVNLSAGAGDTSTASSASFTPNAVGWWCFAGYYSGDSNYQASSDTSTDECFDVTTIASNSATNPTDATITLGNSNTDGITVTGNSSGGSPTGTATFYECGPSANPAPCTSQANEVGSGAVALTAGADDTATASSASLTPTAVGWWCFAGYYSGDPNYSSSADQSTDECFDVTGAPSQTTTSPTQPSVVLGNGDTDQVTVTGTAPMEMLKTRQCSTQKLTKTNALTHRTTTRLVRSCTEVVHEVAVSKVNRHSGGNPIGGSPTGTVTFYVCGPTASPTACTSQTDQVGNPINLVAGADNTSSATSPSFTPTSTGYWCFAGYYSGSTDYLASADATTDECFDVTAATTNTVTQPADSTIVLNDGNSDSVTIDGNAAGGSPTGSISFYECGPTASPTACASQANEVGGTVSLTAGPFDTATASSASFTPTGTGYWCFAGYYSGDSNYQASSDATTDECFDVTPATTSTSTQPVLSTIALGTDNADSVTVEGNAAGGSPTGGVTFYECGPTASPRACTSHAHPVGSAVTLTAGSDDTSTATSSAFTPDALGWWCFAGDYSGDSNYQASSDTTIDECFQVTEAPSQSATTPAQTSIVLGSGDTDQITVTGNATGGSPTGSATFYECGPTPSATACTSQQDQVGSAVHLTAGAGDTATATSASFTPTSTGYWCFAGYYPGDSNYLGSSDATVDECVDVTAAPTATATRPTSATIVLGNGDTDSVTVTGNAAGGAPTGTVDFYECGPTASPTGCTSQADPVALGVPLTAEILSTSAATSPAFTPDATGWWCFAGYYSGDPNYQASSDSGTDECFDVAVIPSMSVTSPNSSSIVLGNGNVDNITVSGNSFGGAPTGTVDFYECGPTPSATACTSQANPLGSVGLTTGVGDASTASSPSFTPDATGWWCFAGDYSGNSDYSGSADTSVDECFDVMAAPSATSTLPTSASIAVGQTDTDGVTVGGNSAGGSPTGTVSFYDCGPSASPTTCTSKTHPIGGAVSLHTGAGDASTATSPSFTPTSPGYWCFAGYYSGSSDYQTSSDTSTEECVDVLQATPTTTTAPTKASFNLGGSDTDGVTVTGNSVAGAPTGTVSFYECGPTPSPTPCTSQSHAVGGAVNVTPGLSDKSTATSASFTPTATGWWCFAGYYTGNTNYLSGADTSTDECFDVQTNDVITSQAHDAHTTLGLSNFDTAYVKGNATLGLPTGTITFYVCPSFHAPGPCTSTVNQLGNPVPLTKRAANDSKAKSIGYSPTQSGLYCFGAYYSGDANYAPGWGSATHECDPTLGNKTVDTGSVQCNSFSGTLTFKPPLQAGSTGTETAHLSGTLGNCQTSGGAKDAVSGGTVTGSFTSSHADCSFFSAPSSLKLQVAYSTPLLGGDTVTEANVSPFMPKDEDTGAPTGVVEFALPTGSVIGSFSGFDAGSATTANFEVSGSSVCGSGSLKSLSVTSGAVGVGS